MTGKSGKRFLAAVLTVCMVLSMAVGASAANTSRFTDVKTSHWAYDEIIDVVDKEIFLGTGATTFAPEMEMSRAMFVTVLARLAGVEVDDRQATGFRDVPTGQWYTGAVAWAAEKEIVKGVSNNTFAPTQVITREQMATMILRYTDYLKIKLPTPEREVRFDDYREISGFAEDAVLACQRAGLLQGVGNNRFNPQGTATRSQVAVLVSRLAEIEGTIAYTVRFEPNNGKTVADQTVMSGKTAKQPTGVTRSGYRLSGWYTDEKLTKRFTFSTKIDGNLTLYAKWSRNSDSGYYVTYTDPVAATEADVGGIVTTTGSPFNEMPLTYPTVTMDGSEIKLSGVYKAENMKRWFGDAYDSKPGYVVPLKLTAPSSYSGGDVILTVTGDITAVNKTIKRDELDGDYYFYLFKFVPADTTGWDPTITVNWNGTAVSYTMDVMGMTEAVVAPETNAKVDVPTYAETTDIILEGTKNLALPGVMVAKTSKENEYKVYLSGGYTLTDTSVSYYTIPLRFYTPSGAFSGSAAVSITGATLNSNQNYNSLSGVTYIDYLLKVPTTLPSGWNPVITVTWTSTQPESRWQWRNAETVMKYTYAIDVSGMGQTKTSKLPTAGTEEQIITATKKDGNDFRGIAPYCANVTLTETSAGSKTFTASGTYAPLPEGQTVPGFGVVGAEGAIKNNSLIIPIMFYRPSGLNIGAMAPTDTLLNIKLYRDSATDAASKKDYALEAIENENPFLFLLRVDAESLNNQSYSRKFVLTWFGGYTETYTIKLGDLKRIGGATVPSIPGPNSDALKAATDGTAFAGIAPLVAKVEATPKANVTNRFDLGGSYIPVPAGAVIPGFGTSGDANAKLDGDWCILPFQFSFTPPVVNTLADDYNLVTIKITGGEAEKSVTLTKSQVMADPSFTYLFLLKDPQKAGADNKTLTFELKWADNKTETFIYDIANLTRSTTNADGAKFQINEADKTGITVAGPFKDIAINSIDILAETKENVTTLKLSQLDAVQKAEKIIPYYGAGYGDGYVVALKFTAPTDGAKYTALIQTVKGGYTNAGAPQVKEITLDTENGAHILLLYIPAVKPYEGYAPEITLTWKGTKEAKQGRWSFFSEAGQEDVTTTQTFKLDLSGMDIKAYTAPKT